MAYLQLDELVLLSLFLQCLLVFVAPLRKRMRSLAIPITWISYLLAFWVADYSISLIPNHHVPGGRTGELRLFWAPYLLLHLGGPSTITALSLSDNELWLRHAARLFATAYTFVRVFLRYSFANNHLWVPTALIFIAGALKCSERLICQFQARLTKFRKSILPDPDPGPNYSMLMEEYKSYKQANVPVRFEMTPTADGDQSHPEEHMSIGSNSKLSRVQIVKEAYRFFHMLQGVFVNSVYSYDERNKSRQFFLSRNAEDAFRICEVELNFACDVFYTKAILIHKGKWHIRNAPLVCQLVSLVLWLLVDKRNFHKKNSVKVTHALLFGSLALELISLFMYLTSDWQIAKMKEKEVDNSRKSSFYEKWLLFKMPRRSLSTVVSRPLLCRWSEWITQFNLIHYSIDKCSQNFLRRHVTKLAYLTDNLRRFIFAELVTRSQFAKQPEDVEELCSARGDWILTFLSCTYSNKGLEANTFSPWITDVEFEESLILWHIATEIRYNTVDNKGKSDLCEFSKLISRYMLDVLIWKPYMMPKSARTPGRLCFNDTYAEAERFFNRVLLPKSKRKKMRKEELLQQACERIMQVNTDISPREIIGDESESVLFDGCRLAKVLKGLKSMQIDEWEIISKVWSEILFFAAAQCSPEEHVRKLGRGGELLTLVWLLMTNLGIGKQFRKREYKCAELVVGRER